ncbi:pyruvate, water dikinase regulatory protein [Niveibacterium umoris]|uniref:posphoenolpyruvate synthetase regulatory kinase/phosphorylase PpsR n=1 Tax=Niveibacterium umoris TaxID=1193620 RepID=UPI00161F154F|nr:pyruvate, water dikinase regulatory protein [Niveibacterium umoris]
MQQRQTRTVFFVSDGTGITAETLGHSLLAQFPEAKFRHVRVPFIDSVDKAKDAVFRINDAGKRDGMRPLVVSTLVNQVTADTLRQAQAHFVDLFLTFIEPLEMELGMKSAHTIGRFHGIADGSSYTRRIDAINFTLSHDDGVSHENLDEADVILVGVSRSGKTPTSLYLAMQFGVRAANYPLIPEDFERNRIPQELTKHRTKLFGLTITPERLSQIRQERRPNSVYASLENCKFEIEAASRLMRREQIPFIDSTARSIEEISAKIMQDIRIDKNGF